MKAIQDEAYLIFYGTHQIVNIKLSDILLIELMRSINAINIHRKNINERSIQIAYSQNQINNDYGRTFSSENIKLYILQDYKSLSNILESKKTIKLKSTLLTKIEDDIK